VWIDLSLSLGFAEPAHKVDADGIITGIMVFNLGSAAVGRIAALEKAGKLNTVLHGAVSRCSGRTRNTAANTLYGFRVSAAARSSASPRSAISYRHAGRHLSLQPTAAWITLFLSLRDGGHFLKDRKERKEIILAANRRE